MTGAGGAVGSAVLRELRAEGRPARAAYHSSAKSERAVAAGDDAVTVDFARPETLPPALAGVRTVFLLGAMGPEQTARECNVVAAAATAGVERVVKLSVWRADEELTPIACLHHPVELALASSGLAWTLLRPNFYMQNFTRQMAGSIATAGVFAQPAIRAPISFVDVADIARVAAVVLTSATAPGRVHNITGPEALTYGQAAEVLSRVLERPVRHVGLSDEEARAGLLGRGLPPFHADALIDVARAYRDGGAESVTTTVSELTGREPTTFEQFVRAHRSVFGLS
ncbi:MAG TPA: NmrA family NAD(P)-binding protein [Pseudonocardia sp.]|nr:NmrA family NAD(P)-binding protein [Pseudonocardia sp.]